MKRGHIGAARASLPFNVGIYQLRKVAAIDPDYSSYHATRITEITEKGDAATLASNATGAIAGLATMTGTPEQIRRRLDHLGDKPTHVIALTSNKEPSRPFERSPKRSRA